MQCATRLLATQFKLLLFDCLFVYSGWRRSACDLLNIRADVIPPYRYRCLYRLERSLC
eukprot:gene6236-4486_t